MARSRIDLDRLIARKVLKDGKSITLKDISSATGISENRLVDYRKGRAKAIKFETIDILCEYFDCTPGELIVSR